MRPSALPIPAEVEAVLLACRCLFHRSVRLATPALAAAAHPAAALATAALGMPAAVAAILGGPLVQVCHLVGLAEQP
eukprot:365482-Chlamydomonas_euryale.AAC.2